MPGDPCKGHPHRPKGTHALLSKLSPLLAGRLAGGGPLLPDLFCNLLGCLGPGKGAAFHTKIHNHLGCARELERVIGGYDLLAAATSLLRWALEPFLLAAGVRRELHPAQITEVELFVGEFKLGLGQARLLK